jgi:hypothetical protein
MNKLVITIFFFSLTIAVMAETEKQKYKVLHVEDNIEIRYYPEAIMASVNVAGDYNSSRGDAFRSLAGYIFGGNENEQKIAMTAPVLMEQKNDSSKMSFVMPAKYDLKSLPNPNNSEVAIKKRPAYYTASIRFNGWGNNEKNKRYTLKLVEWLKKHEFEYTDKVIFKGYDPPFKLVNRRNEVHIILSDHPFKKHSKAKTGLK